MGTLENYRLELNSAPKLVVTFWKSPAAESISGEKDET